MYRPTMPFQSISVACLAAGPIFVATLAVAHIYEMTPKPIPVSVSAGALVAFVPAAILVSGFGFITLTLSLGAEPQTWADAIRFLSSKVGLAVIVLGAMHFFNMGSISHFGRKVNGWLRDPTAHPNL